MVRNLITIFLILFYTLNNNVYSYTEELSNDQDSVQAFNSNSMSIEYGKSVSNIQFTTSSNVKLDYLYPVSNSYIKIGYDIVSSERYYTSVSLNYNTYGSIGSDLSINDLYQWDLDYLGINLNANFNLINTNSFYLNLSAGFSSEWNTRALQRVNNQVFKISNEDEFNPFAFFYNSGLALGYQLYQDFSIYLQYNFKNSFQMNNDIRDSNDRSKMYIQNHSIGLGFNFKI